MRNSLRKFIPPFLISWYHYILSFSSALFYGFPSRKLTVIGVTGTNGKSTVVEMISRILEADARDAASISSIGFKIKGKECPNNLRMTMPGRFFIQRFFRSAVKEGCKYAVLEVTSEGIKQHRHQFIDFSAAILTNLSPEHLEAHGGLENYRRAKMELFKKAKVHIINIDDASADLFLKIPAPVKYGYALGNGTKEEIRIIRGDFLSGGSGGVSFRAEQTVFNLKLKGFFNAYNALATVCFALWQKIDLETVKRALEGIKVIPGRMEEVVSFPFRVFVDYAFTPNALEKVYQALKKDFKPAKMVCVLGACGGGRDKWKRPVLGELAARYCDEIIVTNEDPYDEDPVEIMKQVSSGAKGKSLEMIDRRQAIGKGLTLLGAGDLMIITGKGCESSICLKGGKRIGWDDRKAVLEELEKIRR